jgi:phosphoribosylanthranilate isomerase
VTRIKICGITNKDDMEAAVSYGADALGFIGVKGSPRYVSEQEFFEIAEDAPLFVPRVVVVERTEEAEEYGAEYVQNYSDTAHDSFVSIPPRIRTFRMRDAASLEELKNYSYPVSAILLDTYHKDKLGGSGETFNWELAREAKRLTDKPILLAGGLTPENVPDALEAVHPYAVDVSSGVEASPGVKDHAKVLAFVRAVREWDLRQ